MKFQFLKHFFFFLFTSGFLFFGCKSQKPGFNNSSTTTSTNATSPGSNSDKTGAVPANEQPAKTVGQPAQKLVYDSTKISFKIKQKTEVETRRSADDDDDEIITSSKTERVEKYRKREKEKGNWLSGGFLAVGMALLLVSLVLVIIGSGPAGLLAIIGGSLFLAGFIFTLVALLSR